MDRGVRTSVGNTVTVTIGATHSLDLPTMIIADQVSKKITNFVIEFSSSVLMNNLNYFSGVFEIFAFVQS